MLLTLAACTGTKSDVTAVLDRAEAIMEEYPDSAYTLLYNIDSVTVSGLSRAESARYYLLLGTAMNKTDRPMAFDSLFQHTVVDYYDRHGTRNEQMRARYILGSIYRDQHDSPRAIECYLSATERADTLSPDCDYLTLLSIYGQMAYVYHHQLIPEQEIESNRQYSKYAAKCGNTYEYIRGIELQVGGYQLLDDTATILSIIDSVHSLYLENDMPQEAASIYPAAIYIQLARNNYTEAKRLMDIFEHESGLFDEDGNIVKDRVSYYLAKGLYYEGISKLDSAKYFYHRLIKYGYEFDGYSGLLRVFQKQNITDSINYASKMKDSAYIVSINNQHKEAVMNVKSLYDYTNQERIAKEEKATSTKQIKWIYILIAVLFTIIFFTVKYYIKHRKYSKLVNTLDSKMTSQQSDINNYTQTIEIIQNENSDLKKKIRTQTMHDGMASLTKSDIVAVFKKYASGELYGSPTEKDWKLLEETIAGLLPDLDLYMNQQKLTTYEKRVCILSIISISPSIAAIFMNKQNNSISNLRKKAAIKLFNSTSAAELDNLLSDYCNKPTINNL